MPIPDRPLRYSLTYLIAAGSGLGWPEVIGFMRRAALAEALAHLRHLADTGQIAVTAAEAGEPDLYALVT